MAEPAFLEGKELILMRAVVIFSEVREDPSHLLNDGDRRCLQEAVAFFIQAQTDFMSDAFKLVEDFSYQYQRTSGVPLLQCFERVAQVMAVCQALLAGQSVDARQLLSAEQFCSGLSNAILDYR